MQNPKSVINSITSRIEESVCNGGRAAGIAEEAAESINEEFIVIPRSELPVKQRRWEGNGIEFGPVQETDLNGDPEALKRRGLSYLAMADYLKAKKVQTDEELNGRRLELWREMYPESTTSDSKWRWAHVFNPDQVSITKIIELQDQLAKAQQNK